MFWVCNRTLCVRLQTQNTGTGPGVTGLRGRGSVRSEGGRTGRADLVQRRRPPRITIASFLESPGQRHFQGGGAEHLKWGVIRAETWVSP